MANNEIQDGNFILFETSQLGEAYISLLIFTTRLKRNKWWFKRRVVYLVISTKSTQNALRMLDLQKSFGKHRILEIWIPHFRTTRAHFYLQIVFRTWKDFKCHWSVSSSNTLFYDISQGPFYTVYIHAWVVCLVCLCLWLLVEYTFSQLNLVYSAQLTRLGGIRIVWLVLLYFRPSFCLPFFRWSCNLLKHGTMHIYQDRLINRSR